MTDDENKPTKKQQVFIDEYLKCFNGAEAARRAGYSEKSARFQASKLLEDSNISQQIKARLEEVHMGAEEALKLMSDIARGDIADVVNSFGGLDLQVAQERGKTGLIKKIKQRTITKIGKNETDGDVEIHDVEFEMYNKQEALRDILKITGRYVERQDITTNGKQLEIGIKHVDYRNGIPEPTE